MAVVWKLCARAVSVGRVSGNVHYGIFLDLVLADPRPPRANAGRTAMMATQKEVLNFKPAPRLEQIGDKCSKQIDDRKHRIG